MSAVGVLRGRPSRVRIGQRRGLPHDTTKRKGESRDSPGEVLVQQT